jgi:hypothetical protein
MTLIPGLLNRRTPLRHLTFPRFTSVDGHVVVWVRRRRRVWCEKAKHIDSACRYRKGKPVPIEVRHTYIRRRRHRRVIEGRADREHQIIVTV